MSGRPAPSWEDLQNAADELVAPIAGDPHERVVYVFDPALQVGKVEEALNFGYEELLDHDQRYDRADEYMELCYRLWSSWDPDAVVMDQRTDTFADPAEHRWQLDERLR